MNDFLSIAAPLFVAHLLIDFFLQPQWLIKHKEKYKLSSYWFWAHALGAGILAYVILAKWAWHPVLWITFVSHALIDLWKISSSSLSKKVAFYIDQTLHIMVLISLAIWISGIEISVIINELFSLPNLITITGLLLLTKPAALIIQKFIKEWEDELDEDEDNSLTNAGEWIGITERIIIYILVIANQFTAIGFLFAAKSILRFESNRGKRKQSEYVLLGTLLSFTIAILVGWVVVKLIS